MRSNVFKTASFRYHEEILGRKVSAYYTVWAKCPQKFTKAEKKSKYKTFAMLAFINHGKIFKTGKINNSKTVTYPS